MRYYKKRISKKSIEKAYSNISGVGVFGVFVILFSSLFFMLGVSAYVIDNDISAFILGCIGISFGILLIIIGKQKVKADEEEQAQIKKEQEENAKQQELERLNKIAHTSIEKIDLMSGIEFEEFLKAVYINLGYDAQLTKASGDFGADLIIKKDNYSAIIQAKCYTTHKVTISAIQEIIGAKNHYRIYNALVITNNFFTTPAQKLASENNVELIDRNKLVSILYNNGLSVNNLAPNIVEKKKDLVFDYSDINHDSNFSKELYSLVDKVLDASNEFNITKTRKLLNDFYSINLKTNQDYITYHFCIAKIVLMIYRLRDISPDFIKDILDLCDKDIEILPVISHKLNGATIPALTKKAIILTKQNKFNEVIELCDFAIKYSFKEENGTSFLLRKEKTLQKIKEGI